MYSFLFFKRMFSFGILLAASVVSPAYATVFLTINPIDGSSGIRFERVLPDLKNAKQLQIRITSTDAKQYQVFQRVFEPISNEKGQSLNLSSIETVTMSNSNTSGTLYIQNADHLSYSEQLLYTSGQSGAGDSFMVVYNALPNAIGNSGHFNGKIVFTVRVLGQADQVESVVDFSLVSEAQLKVSVQGAHELKRVRIKDQDVNEGKTDFVRSVFSGNGAQEIKFYQEFISALTNEAGIEFPLDAIRLSVQGSAHVRPVSLASSRILVYSSNVNEDEFAIYFLINPEKLQAVDAGLYKGQIKYIIETGTNQQEFVIEIECNVRPIFTMDITPPPEGISFSHVLPASPAEEKQVLVSVRSNLHKPYQVLQSIVSPMTNEKGKEFDKKYFTFKVNIPSDQKSGHTQYAEASVMETGEYLIYASDVKGSPATFSVTYQLKGYFDMSSGNFVAPLKFSLNQN